MRYLFSTTLLTVLLLIFVPDYAKQAISYGTIELTVTSADPADDAEPTSAPAVFLYYGDYLVEKFQSARTVNNSVIYTDSAFCFIDLQKKHCTEYDGISSTAKEITSYPLINKTFGYLFPADSVTQPENYRRVVNMSDTAIDFYTYKRFYIISNTKDSITYYVSPFQIPIPFHLNKMIDDHYKGTLVRIDAAKLGTKTPDLTSLRMQIYPNRMYSNELTVISMWIARVTGKRL